MLIKVFDKWINPKNISYVVQSRDGHVTVYFNAIAATAYEYEEQHIVIQDSTLDEVAAEINKQFNDESDG